TGRAGCRPLATGSPAWKWCTNRRRSGFSPRASGLCAPGICKRATRRAGPLNIFAIGDLHLPGRQDKPMDVFGSAWENHPQKIREAWREVVSEDDVVLVPGDISWAMTLADAEDDLAYLGSLPGRIIMIRGNHDYWWSG